MNLADILKDSNYKLSQFSPLEIDSLERSLIIKQTKSGDTPYINCLVRNKEIKLSPEEVIRQLYLQVLTQRYHYPISRIKVEYIVTFGREKKRADIAILDKDRPTVPYIIVELKKPKLKDGKEQLRSYCNATGAPIAVWTNGDQISYYQRKDPNYFEDITDIPNANQTLADILNEKFTLEDLIKKDKLVNEKKSLKTLIEEMEDEVLANAGVDVFEEVFKLIFTKLYDEWLSGRGNNRKTRLLEFRNTGQTEIALKNKIQDLFDRSKKHWEGVFSEDSRIALTPSHLSVCVSSLENVKLFNSNLEVVDEAFEYLINQSSKGEKGQYFTPRYVIDMCVKMLNPKEDEYMIDTAAGSSGFPVHSIFHVWQQIIEDEGIKVSNLFSLEDKPYRCEKYVHEKVFAIDFDEKAVRVARTLILIAGDGQTNVLHLNTLDYEMWDEVAREEDWQNIYFEGFKRLKKLRKSKDSYKYFQFDILMANPPFAGDIKESRIIAQYDLAKKPNGNYQSKVGRDILFIERNLEFLKPGGRMAIVLPQGRFNNSSDKDIRDFIAQRCRILAVVGLHGNTFKPHTGTKTSVLFVQKWNDDAKAGALCPKVDDYNIFFATMRKSGKDNSGDKIWRRIVLSSEEKLSDKEKDKAFVQDIHGHLVVDHDLFNHDGLMEDGIAEAFIEFAKKENLSFFKSSPSVTPFDAQKYQRLMDGLEAVQISLNQLKTENNTLRVDAEYYQKQHLKLAVLLKKIGAIDIKNIGAKLDCSAFYPSITQYYCYQEFDNIPFLRVDEIQSGLIQITENTVFLPEFVLFENQSTICRVAEGDIVIAKGGNTLAKVGLVPKDFSSYAACRDVIVLKTNNLNNTNKFFLWAFLHSQHGQNLMLRTSSQTGQPHLTLDSIYGIPVPILNMDFQEKFENIYHLVNKLKDGSKICYQQAEELLLSELNLKDWQPTEENIAEKSFASSFLASGRLDAEYYQPKYDELEDRIKSYYGGWDYLGNMFAVDTGEYSEEYLPKSNRRKFYIRNTNIRIGRIEVDDDYYVNPHNFSKFTNEGDILTARVGAIGSFGTVSKELSGSIYSDNVLSLRLLHTQSFLPNVYTLYFNTRINRELMNRFSGGSVQPLITQTIIKSLPIPLLKLEVQTKLNENINKSFELKIKSKQLLEIAKTGVEKAIETDEGEATAWMNQQLAALGINLLSE